VAESVTAYDVAGYYSGYDIVCVVNSICNLVLLLVVCVIVLNRIVTLYSSFYS
jgi:hypothetical protein